jgi:arylsulfatase A-like enzyme
MKARHLIAAILLLSGCGEAMQPPPNIVMIIADDMAWDDCGAYGHPSIRTLNIDRLAEEGMRFDNAFLTCSSCSPSRSSIITGRYPHNTGAEQLHWPLPADQVTFVELLRQSGYWTAAAGKWHLGEAVKDRFDLVVEPGMSGFILSDPQEKGGQPTMVAPNRSGCEDWIPVLNRRPEGKPFFLWLAAFDPHRDYEEDIIYRGHSPREVRVPPYLPDVPEVRKDLAMYYDEIARLDSFVGLVLSELERQGMAENTLVLFLSDNGRPFPRDKTTLYDGGIRTPFIVRWPQQVKPGSVCRSLVSSVDIAPTMLDLAGTGIPKHMEGTSFKTLLMRPDDVTREYIFAEDHWHDYEDLTRAVRSTQYKYIRNDYPDLPATPSADAGRSMTFRAMNRLKEEGKLSPDQLACYLVPRPEEEFYNVLEDPFELNNLADDPEYREIIQQHRNALDEWSEATGFRIPKNRTPDEFDRTTGQPTAARIRPRPDKEWFIETYEIE